jgi:hypothetical protein
LPKLGLLLIDLFKKMNGSDAAKEDGKSKNISTYNFNFPFNTVTGWLSSAAKITRLIARRKI